MDKDQYMLAARSAVQREEWVSAWHLLNRELNERPDRPEALYLMGHVLRVQGHAGLALPTLSKALSMEQKIPNLWMQYGATLHDLNRWEEAIQAFRVAEKMIPADPMPYANQSGSLVNMGKWNEAINMADKALAIDSENYIARIAKAFGCLGLGRWKDAWEHSEYLYGNHLDVRIYCDPEEPDWDGSKGKTVVVQCDQGVGDILMFAQLLPRLQKDCKQVIVETTPRMVPLMQRNFPGIDFYGTLKEKGFDWQQKYHIDAHVHISKLPRFYLNRDSDFERKPYITANPEMKAKWLEDKKDYPNPWIGIAWQGGIQNTQKHLRSLELEELAPVLSKKGTFFDLSYHDSAIEVARWNIDHENQIVSPKINKENFDATVALIDSMDEIVTVTTTVAHVCGALGKKARVLVNETPQWRYAYRYNDGKELIWYAPDSVQLYRRKKGELDWSPTITRLAKDLP